MSDSQRLTFLRLCFGLFSILLAGTAYEFSVYLNDLNVLFALTSEWWLMVLGLAILSAVLFVLLLLTWTKAARFFLEAVARLYAFLGRFQFIAIIVLLLMVAAYPRVVFGASGDIFSEFFPRFLMCAIWVLVSAVALKVIWPARGFPFMLVSAALLIALLHQGVVLFQAVSTFPFSLGWSEVSRYYYGSLFFSERVYGFEIPPSVLHPTRYMMQALPFLIEGLPLWFHRLWQVLLWIGTSALTSILLVRRLSISDRLKNWLVAGWIFLFLFVGPIYYHLQVAAIIVLWSFNRQKIVRSTIFILIASAWAGISRVNWYPVPGMIAAVLFFLEKPVALSEDVPKISFSKFAHYLSLPLMWVFLGSLVAFGAQSLYVLWSGNDPGQFTSSFTSDLLWYRLWPNVTYPLGILPAVLLFSLPFLILLFIYWLRGKSASHQLRWLGIAVILLVLFTGGLVVSVKIGGGSNLHNMDAYLMVLLVVCAYLYAEKFVWEPRSGQKPVRISWRLSAILILMPILYLVPVGGPQHLPDQETVDTAMEELSSMVTDAVQAGGEVLFVTQRQLLMFDSIPDVPLIPEYEVVFLMEMAMGDNEAYLGKFYDDVENHRFTLVIIDWLPKRTKGPEDAFSEEHNAWFLRVARPLQKEYERLELYEELGIEVVAPKP
jgi:hypothetical protein